MSSETDGDSGFEQLLKEAVRQSTVSLPQSTLQGGRFVIQRLLGSGGMGVVYRATDVELEREVALKTLISVSASGIYRLKQESRVLADVVHPNLVGLHELFCDEGQWFFTMDLVPGSSLLDYLTSEPDEARLRDVFAQLATGIRAIHEAEKLHRDLKPTNALITPNGRVVILDFGLATDQEEAGAGQTIGDESISGTPLYMAPEQAAGRPATRASDWYCFGLMLFEALTGRPPWTGTRRSVLQRKQQEDAPRPSAFREGVSADLDQLCGELMRRAPQARPGFEQVMRVLGSGRSGLDSWPIRERGPFVGRTEELGALQEAFEATHQGRPVVVYVHGVSGVGKTSLVERFLTDLREAGKAVVLTGRCHERESVPFKTCDSLIDALSRHLGRLPPERAANLLPSNVHAIGQLFPVLKRLEFMQQLEQHPPLPPDPNELRQVAYSAFKELLSNLAAREPLVLFVDDLQWSDVDGAKLLSSVLSRPDPPSLLLVGTYRRGEEVTSVGLSTLVARIQEFEEAEVREVELGGLSEKESRHLARDLLPDENHGRAAQIVREAQGNPFFITELSRLASNPRDDAEQIGLEAAIQSRVARLTDTERELLDAICVSARPIQQSLLRAAAPTGDVTTAIRRLQSERLVRKTAFAQTSKVRSYHDRIREAVVAGLDQARIEVWHGKLARAIEASAEPDLIALTEHLLGARDDSRAGSCAIRAADYAAETLAFDNAARLYQIALELNPGDREEQRQLQTKLGTALANAGRGAQAARAFMQAAEGAVPEEEIELRHLAAYQWITTGHMPEGLHELDNVLKTVGLGLHTRRSASIVDLLANRLRIKLRGLDFKARRASELSKKELLRLRACWTVTRGTWAADNLQAAAFCSRYLRLALSSGSTRDIALGLAHEVAFLSTEGVGKRALIEEYLSRSHRLSQSIDDPRVVATIRMAQGIAACFLGEIGEAFEQLKSAENNGKKCTGTNDILSTIRSFLGYCYARLGYWRELSQKWDVWTEDAQERNDLHLLTILRTWEMGVYRWLAADRVDKARDTLNQGREQWPAAAFATQRHKAAVAEASVHLYTGDYRQSFDILAEVSKATFTSIQRRFQTARVHNAHSLAVAALGLASTTRDRKPLLRIASQQARTLRREKSPLAAAYLYYVEGCMAYLRGDEESAVACLQRAVVAFDEIQFKLSAAATNRQLGRLLGGDEGRDLVAQADAIMQEESIVNPERVTAMLAPGFPA